VAIQYAWEPVIWRGGRKETPVKPMIRDWHSGRIAMKKNFYGAKPLDFNTWILKEDTCLCNAPVAKPTDENKYTWNESTLTWDIVEV
jgi:hypothetical protein